MKSGNKIAIIVLGSIFAPLFIVCLLITVPRLQRHYQQGKLADELGVSSKDYPGYGFPIPYFETVLQPGMRIEEVHQFVRGYTTVYRCKTMTERYYSEIYYYYSSDDYKALRFEIFYDQHGRFEEQRGEDSNSRSIHVTGCEKGIIEKSSNAPRSVFLVKFLAQPTCRPPCWEGMTPGLTTMKEVWNKLSKNSDLQIVNWHVGSNTIKWLFDASGESGQAEGDEEGLLNSFSFDIKNQMDTLNEFLLAYSPPDYVDLILAGPHLCTVKLIYISIGMTLMSSLECKEVGPSSSENYLQVYIGIGTPIENILLYRPEKDGYLKTFGSESISDLSIEWYGTGEYQKNY